MEGISDLMLRWEETRQQGRLPSPEELCADCPHLVDELRRRTQAVLTMERMFGFTNQGPPRTLIGSPSFSPGGPDSNWDHEPLPTIAGYEITRVIDRGGMGIVYEARQVSLGRKVAIKMIAGGHVRPAVVARFRAEAEAAARLQHPNFVQVFEVGQVTGRPFFSMEFVAGGSLAEMLAKEHLTSRRAAELVETLARAVSAAHERGIIHRDLKPSNVMLSADGVPKIADFGLAKKLDDVADHTHTGEILGTPSYMAPEQAEGKKDQIGPATDVYALGVILYELLAGTPPFRGKNPLDSLRLVVDEEPVPPSRAATEASQARAARERVPPDLEAICLKCLEKRPDQRYASALALADDLRRFLDGKPVTARRIGPAGRTWKWMRRHPQAAALCGIVALLALVPIFLLVGYIRAEQEVRARALAAAPAVREILERNCFECHGRDPKNVERNLHILNHQDLIDSARRIVIPGAPYDSRLIQRIDDGSMPPEKEETRLPRVSEQELVILRNWITGGAPPFPTYNTDPGLAAPPASESAAQAKAIFLDRCYECHKHDVAKGGIKILHHRLLVSVRKVVVPGSLDDSELFRLITSTNAKFRMPPPPARRLPPEEIAVIRAWILEGAPPFPKSE